MAAIPRSKRPKHIPPLPPDSLTVALQKLEASNISKAGKEHLAAILRTAANGDSENVEVIIATFDDERKRNVNETRQVMAQFTGGIVRRGKLALDNLSDAEWDRLVDEAARGQ
jgi:hypothetical protein